MLPQYLIARWKGINVLPLPLGRSYLDRFGPNYEAYDNIAGPLYQALKKEPNDFNKMWKEAVKLTRERNTGQECMRKMEQALRNEYSVLKKAGSLLVVETGLQATMPLFLESVFDNMEWFMLTAAPWLLDIYHDQIFCHQYSMLRPCETLFCTDNLFIVSFEDGKCFARETLNPLIRNLAYWEIAALKQRSS